MNDTSSTISLIVGISIPIVMVLAIAAAVLLPGRSFEPTTNFIYAIGSYPTYITRSGTTVTQHSLTVKNGTLTDTTQNYEQVEHPSYPFEKESLPRLFLHNTVENTNKELTIDEAKTYTLSAEQKSPEGATIAFGKRSYGVFPFFFDEGSSNGEHAYLSNQTASKEIHLSSDTTYDFYSFQLVGWVVGE